MKIGETAQERSRVLYLTLVTEYGPAHEWKTLWVTLGTLIMAVVSQKMTDALGGVIKQEDLAKNLSIIFCFVVGGCLVALQSQTEMSASDVKNDSHRHYARYSAIFSVIYHVLFLACGLTFGTALCWQKLHWVPSLFLGALLSSIFITPVWTKKRSGGIYAAALFLVYVTSLAVQELVPGCPPFANYLLALCGIAILTKWIVQRNKAK